MTLTLVLAVVLTFNTIATPNDTALAMPARQHTGTYGKRGRTVNRASKSGKISRGRKPAKLALALRWVFGNGKLAKTFGKGRAIGFGLKAWEGTCIGAGACKSCCFAKRGRYGCGNVDATRWDNDIVSRSAGFADLLISDLTQIVENMRLLQYIRIHDSGDFHSQAYLNAWIEAARTFPRITFYAYTKSSSLLDFSAAPDNLVWRASTLSIADSAIDTEKRHAVIFHPNQDPTEYGYVDGTHSDMPAAAGDVKVGLQYHTAAYTPEIAAAITESHRVLNIAS